MSLYSSRFLVLLCQKRGSCSLGIGRLGEIQAGAAFSSHVLQDGVDRLVVGGADHLAPAALLSNETGLRESAQMMRQRCCRHTEHPLHGTDVCACRAGTHEELEDAQARSIAQRRQGIGRSLLALLFPLAHELTI